MTREPNAVDLPPRAEVLIESMRDIGYSLETALADIVDNAIAAGARNVVIRADTTGPTLKVGIADDGEGMTRKDLLNAMQLGSRHPNETRRATDLGRFGLGLKTASFSQCRRLTVATRHAGATSVAIWDLDHVAAAQTWSLLTPPSAEGLPFLDTLGPQGALVLWENLDRHLDSGDLERQREAFTRRVDEARGHLELVFHRYLAGEPGKPKLRIELNGRDLKPFDPFHSAHTATIRAEPETIQMGKVSVNIQPYTLPHHRKVSAADWERYAGPEGYVRNQGFYLYRQRRLIIHGTWFGLARQTELTKLARISIDIPTELDTAWHIDVKKASARPPAIVRDRLKRIIETLGAPSKRVYKSKGKVLHDSRVPLWQRRQTDGAITYVINANNPVLAEFRDALPPGVHQQFDRVIRIIGAALPVDAVFADLAESPEDVKGESLSKDELRDALEPTLRALRENGIPESVVPEMLRTVEPFRSNWERVEEMLDTPDEGDAS